MKTHISLLLAFFLAYNVSHDVRRHKTIRTQVAQQPKANQIKSAWQARLPTNRGSARGFNIAG